MSPSATPSIRGRDVVTLDTFSPTELRHVIDRAIAMKGDDPKPLLMGRSMAMVFFDPSLRTRASFSIAFQSLGGSVIDMNAGRDLWPLEFRDGAIMDGVADEHVCDAAAVLSEYADVIAIRSLAGKRDWARERRDMVIVSFQKHAAVPIFNMESVLDHPCQAWGDGLTLTEAWGETRGKTLALTWTYHPSARPLAVPHGVGLMASRLGMNLRIARPPEFPLDSEISETMRRSTNDAGATFQTFDSMDEALEGADAVYAAPWGSLHVMAEPDAHASLRNRYRDWCVTHERMARTHDAHILHAMPVRRNVEVEDRVINAPRSLVRQQAANRLHIQRALFREVLGA